MKTLTVYVPNKYKEVLQEVANKQDVTVSEAFRRIYSLNEQEFDFTFSVKEKPLLQYAQSLAVLLYSFSDHVKLQREFYKERGNKIKEDFYNFVYAQSSTQYAYYESALLPLLDRGFNLVNDNASVEQFERVEAMSYLIEKGDKDVWKKIKKLAKRYMRK